jgi:hypothetical protein
VKGLTPVDLKPWTLPLLVLALCVPAIAAFGLAGPAAGLAVGALAAAVIIVFAARAQFDEEIEVAPADGRRHLLVVAMEAIEEPGAAEEIANAAAGGGVESADVLVVAPALNTTVSHWLSDLRRARLGAQQRLAVSLAVLAAAGLDARGQVGDTDPVQATEDVLRDFPASEVVYVAAGRSGRRAVTEVRRRLDRPVRNVAGKAATS